MLSRIVPGALVRWFAKPYIAGHSIDEVLSLAQRENETHGFYSTLDLLGESVTNQAQADANIRIYSDLIERLAHDARFSDPEHRPTISLKPSAFTAGAPESVRAPITELVEKADRHNVGVTIDMEDHPWTDLTLDLSIELFERGLDVGTVIQTRLNRTEADLDRFPANMRVRLVIGIYAEPTDIAITDKREMKDRMLRYSKKLLARGVRVEFASHDEEFVVRFAREVAPAAEQRCEVQMLLGVPRHDLLHKLQSGQLGCRLPARIYAPFSIGPDSATAYLRRRMDESPNIVWLVLRNLFPSRGVAIPPAELPPTLGPGNGTPSETPRP